MQNDTDVISGDDYFDDLGAEPESNGDVTSPVGDIDSEAESLDLGDETDEEVGTPSEDVEDAETDRDDAQDEHPDPDPEDEAWLPGFEGRFKQGEEEKALAAYREMEQFHSRTVNEMREQIAAERDAAFKQAAEMLKAQQPQTSVLQQIQERQQIAALAAANPGEAFQAAMQTGDDATIDAVIKAVAEGDPMLGIEGSPGDALRMQQVVLQMRQQAAIEEQNRTLNEYRAKATVDAVTSTFKNQYQHVLDNEDLAAEFARVLQTDYDTLGDPTDPAQVQGFLERSLRAAVGAVAFQNGFGQQQTEPTTPVAPIQQQVERRAAKRRAHTETGNTPRASVKTEKTEEEQYADDLLAAARHIKPVI